MQILNLTPHKINIVDQNGNETHVFESTGIARATATKTPQGEINGIPIVVTTFGEVEGLPDPQEGVMLIVSVITAQAAQKQGRDCSDLLLTDGLTRKDPETGIVSNAPNAKGDIIGCSNLALFAPKVKDVREFNRIAEQAYANNHF